MTMARMDELLKANGTPRLDLSPHQPYFTVVPNVTMEKINVLFASHSNLNRAGLAQEPRAFDSVLRVISDTGKHKNARHLLGPCVGFCISFTFHIESASAAYAINYALKALLLALILSLFFFPLR